VTSTAVSTITGQQRAVRVTSNTPINWATQRGFYLDLPEPGERQVSDSILRNGRLVFSTLIPNTEPCSFGGRSFVFALDVRGGIRPDAPFFDVNLDRILGSADMLTVNGQPASINAVESPGGMGIVGTPGIQISGTVDTSYWSGSDGQVAAVVQDLGAGPIGRQAWRRITQ